MLRTLDSRLVCKLRLCHVAHRCRCFRCVGRMFAALAPAFGEYGLPVERLSGAELRGLLALPGVMDHPAVERALSAALDTGPAWPQVVIPLIPPPPLTVVQVAMMDHPAMERDLSAALDTDPVRPQVTNGFVVEIHMVCKSKS